MFADLVDTIDISTTAIYGDNNLGCAAGNRTIEVERTDPVDQGYDCLSEVIAIVAMATQNPIVDAE